MKSDIPNDDEISLKIDDTEMDSILAKALASVDKLRDNDYVEELSKEPLEDEKQDEGDEIDEEEPADTEELEVESDYETEPEPEKEYKKEKSDKATDKEKYRKLQNDKHRALAEKAAAENRIRELEDMLTESLSAGTYHYGKSAYAELDRAKKDRKEALTAGDIDALEAADDAIFNAKLTIRDLEKWANESAKTSPKPTPQNNQYQPQYDANATFQQEMIKDWIAGHPYIDPDSKKYDPNMVLKVTRFAKKLDADQMYEPFSPQYMDELDDYIDSVKAKRTPAPVVSIPRVGGVRNSYAGNKGLATQKSKQLSADEMEIAKMFGDFGVTEDSYKKYKQG